MEPEFWHRRWRKNEIAFHQQEINAHLQQFRDHLELPAGGQVFVPLCGKSLDMLWLADHGYRVLGVELSPVAVADFFRENECVPQVRHMGAFECWEVGEISLWCGDFFALTAADLSTCAAVYDRAALIALPPAMRQDYARHLQAILPPAAGILLVTLEYPQERIAGPPFAVAEPEVQALYGARYEVEWLGVDTGKAQNPRFLEAGVTHWIEKVYLLRPRAGTAAAAGS